jgi:CheY-like chemotaxis protein
MCDRVPRAPTVVLIVEDEVILRFNAVSIAEDAGFEVLEAANADEAIILLESHTDIRILFTDIDMPGSMDGLRLSRAVRDRWPPIKIILTSGHVKVQVGDIPDGSLFFTKPYQPGEISAALLQLAA